ncbi:MAG: hypothetical protein AAFX40_00395 [Cyanobacteria bacterium J06639_1]
MNLVTELLEKAIAQLKTCDSDLQNAIASLLLNELAGEAAGDVRVARSESVPSDLAIEVLPPKGEPVR